MLKQLALAILFCSTLFMTEANAGQEQPPIITKMIANSTDACVTLASVYADGIYHWGTGKDEITRDMLPEKAVHPEDQQLWLDMATAGLLTMQEYYDEAKEAAKTPDENGFVTTVFQRETAIDMAGVVYNELQRGCNLSRGDLAMIKALKHLSPFVWEIIGRVEGKAQGERINFIKVQNADSLPLIPKTYTSGPEEDAWYAAFRIRNVGCLTHNWDVWVRKAIESGASTSEIQIYAVDQALKCMDVEKPDRFKVEYLD